jgi:NAD(P)H dehydrogenase (quinone)
MLAPLRTIEAMNILIVFAHPEPASFNGALKNVAVDTLVRLGHEVVVSDLYRMGWNAALGPGDFEGERANPDYLDLSKEQEHAFANNSHTAAVKAEQAKVAAADLVLFHFPIWWFSMPAILKGWVDRVFSRGFAYSAGRKYESGHFKGKRAMLCITTGTASTLYEPNGIDGDLHHVLWPIHNGILAYTGFTVLPPFAAWMPARGSDQQRQAQLAAYAKCLTGFDSVEPLFFHPWSDYDETQRLKPGVIARSGVQWNPRAQQSFEQSAQAFDEKNAPLIRTPFHT